MTFRFLSCFLVFCFFQVNSLIAVPEKQEEGLKDHQIIHKIKIKSTAEEAWKVLVDFENYKEWNTFSPIVQGEAKEGAIVTVAMKKEQKFFNICNSLRLEITKMEAPSTLHWVDVSWFTKLGSGGWRERSIEKDPDGDGIIVTNHFEYTGRYYFLKKISNNFLSEGMLRENEDLKKYLEKNASENNSQN